MSKLDHLKGLLGDGLVRSVEMSSPSLGELSDGCYTQNPTLFKRSVCVTIDQGWDVVLVVTYKSVTEAESDQIWDFTHKHRGV